MNLLTRFVGNVEFSLHDDLHLVIGVSVDEWGACLESVEAARDRFLGIILVAVEMLDWACADGSSLSKCGRVHLEYTSPRNAFSLAIKGGLKEDCALL